MQKSHKDNLQISEIMCYKRYYLQNVKNEIDFNKLYTFISQHAFHSLKHENGILDMFIFYRGLSCLTVNNFKSI